MNDLIQIIRVLDQNDLAVINAYIDTLSFSDSTIFATSGGTRTDTSIRSSKGCHLAEAADMTKFLHSKINKGLEKYYAKVSEIHNSFKHYPVPCGNSTTCWREGIQILEYQGNQEYKFHHDCATDPNIQAYERKLSIILYLSDGFEGGKTEFLHDSFKPAAGSALMFPSNWCYPHSGQPVTSGKKRVAVTWYYVDNVHFPNVSKYDPVTGKKLN